MAHSRALAVAQGAKAQLPGFCLAGGPVPDTPYPSEWDDDGAPHVRLSLEGADKALRGDRLQVMWVRSCGFGHVIYVWDAEKVRRSR